MLSPGVPPGFHSTPPLAGAFVLVLPPRCLNPVAMFEFFFFFFSPVFRAAPGILMLKWYFFLVCPPMDARSTPKRLTPAFFLNSLPFLKVSHYPAIFLLLFLWLVPSSLFPFLQRFPSLFFQITFSTPSDSLGWSSAGPFSLKFLFPPGGFGWPAVCSFPLTSRVPPTFLRRLLDIPSLELQFPCSLSLFFFFLIRIGGVPASYLTVKPFF